MDDALAHTNASESSNRIYVLILVVMDDALALHYNPLDTYQGDIAS